MPSKKQDFGNQAEGLVASTCDCPRCKRPRTLKRLPQNFKCADVICDFCGYLAQVKAMNVRNPDRIPDKVLGGAWGVQEARLMAGIYFPLFLVLVGGGRYSIRYLPADLQTPDMYVSRKPLSQTARRAGWQGFYYDLKSHKDAFAKRGDGVFKPARNSN